MRPKLLEIEGLQSFTQVQKIDFETLGETGLFGIFGPTGSGKSTILDAITFALYGRVKRADGGTQGIINSTRNTARVSFTFELKREGIRKTYRVERTYQRKKNSPNSCEPKIARLIEITEAGELPLCDKAMDVSYHIRDLLGLGNEDFTRAVVLPQNSFQEFLMLSNSDRRGMLERIFYLEEYGKQLTDKLGRRMARQKSSIDMLSGELKGYEDATDEVLEEARKAMNASAAERKEADKKLKQLEGQFSEANEVWGLISELADFTHREEQHATMREGIDAKRLQLDRALKADGLREIIQRSRESETRLKESQKQLETVTAVLPGVNAELEALKIKYDELKNNIVSEQPKLVEMKTRLTDALDIRRDIIVLAQRISALQQSISDMKGSISARDEAIRSVTAELAQTDNQLEKMRHESELYITDPTYRRNMQDGVRLENEAVMLEANRKELEARETALRETAAALEVRLSDITAQIEASQRAFDELTAQKQKHEEKRPGDKNTVVRFMDKIHSVQGQYSILRLRQAELDQMLSRANAREAELDQAVRKAEVLEHAKNGAAEALEKCRQEFKTASAEAERNTAYLLAQSLKAGEPCPVCGSMEHPVPAAHTEEADTGASEQKAAEAEARTEAADKTFRQAEREALVASEQVKALTKLKSQADDELTQKSREFQEEKQKLPEKLRELPLEQIGLEVERAGIAYRDKLAAIEAWEKALNELDESLKKLNTVLTDQRIHENGIASEVKVNRENAGQLAKTLAEADAVLEGKNQEVSAFLHKYGIENAGAELARLAENDRKLQLLQQEMEHIQAASVQKKTLLEQTKEELQEINNGCIKLEAEYSGLNGQKSEKEARLRELAGNADIETEIRRIDEKLSTYSSLEEEYRQHIELLDKRYRELDTQRSLYENQSKIYSENLAKDETILGSVLADKGFACLDEAEHSILAADSQKMLRGEIDEYDQATANIKAQKDLLHGKLKGRSITEEEWNRINSSYQEMKISREECVSRSEVARIHFETTSKKHEKWVELGRNYTELTHKQGLFEQIQKILKAEHRKDNSFIDYIAEERLRYVAARASETLGLVTKYRYALELDVESGFIIRDNANGGVHRMVTSLSGGETFLTSLSLALALSEQIQLKGQSPLEFFFLDEGFGTLDAELLDTVIDALERLSSRERVIGLISHVPELKSRIGRRLVVDPPSLQNDGSRVTIERA